jgi:hypothetical protein
MARQKGLKRVRASTKIQQNESDDDDDNESTLKNQDIEPSKKKVRWDAGTNDSGGGDQDDSDDELGGPQKVSRYLTFQSSFHSPCVIDMPCSILSTVCVMVDSNILLHMNRWDAQWEHRLRIL